MSQPRQPIETEKIASADRLTSEQFASELQECYSRLWVLAAAILGDKHQAEDIVQDAAIVAMRQLDQFKPGTNFKAWMSTIVRFQAFNRSRKRVRQRTQSVDPTTLDFRQEETDSPPPALDIQASLPSDQTHFDDSVMNALNDIGEVPRACLLLRTLHDLSYAEISELLDIAEGTAMSHVHRSKSKMRQRLDPSVSAGKWPSGDQSSSD